MIPQEDGSMAISAETQTHYITSGDNGYAETALYGSIVTMEVNPNGKLSWAKYIPKKQLFWQVGINFNGFVLYTGTFFGGLRLMLPANSSKYIKYFGSVAGVQNDKLIVIYNDHKANTANTSKKDRKTMKSVKSARPVARVYDLKTGDMTQKDVKKGKQSDAPFNPTVSYRTNDGSIIVFGQKGKRFKFGELSLN